MLNVRLDDHAVMTKADYIATLLANEQEAMAALAHATTPEWKSWWGLRVRFWRSMKNFVDSTSQA